MTFATEKEIVLCLNTRVLFEPLMIQAKRDNDDVQYSITQFFMYDWECTKSSNGYFH